MMIWKFQTIAKLTTALLLHYYRKLWTEPLSILIVHFMGINFENISILGSDHMDLLVHGT